ncbi:MAG: glycosyltransferase family 4 protein [Rhodospirillum sp.]|nr:glycosyltransferase family 4 protein [Rhodospirillum sp.]MCF8488088.1 glycosyltransferase family 4 protein [Rhodospirillum sp.]MCF8499884.1 glycosyltransferase family 4 protein [Rhodospirillum sp.]
MSGESERRILLWHWGRRGGGPLVTLGLAQAFAALPGVRTHLSLSRQSDLFIETTALGLPGHHVTTYTSRLGFATGLARLPFLIPGFLSFLRAKGITDVICPMTHLWNAATLPALKQAGIGYTLMIHDATLHPGEDTWSRRVLGSAEIAQADRILAPTRHVAERLETLGIVQGRPLGVAPMGPMGPSLGSLIPIRSLPTKRPPRLLFFGRMIAYKGLDLLVDAFPAIRAALPGAELRMVGGGCLPTDLRDRAESEGIILRNEWIPESAVSDLLDWCDAVILPYREASQSGLIPLCYQRGIPAIATPVGALPEQLEFGAAGTVSQDLSASGLADATTALLTDPDRYRSCSLEMIRLGRDVFTWKNSAQAILALLDKPVQDRQHMVAAPTGTL